MSMFRFKLKPHEFMLLITIIGLISLVGVSVARADDAVFGTPVVTNSEQSVRVIDTLSPEFEKAKRPLESVTGPKPKHLSGCKHVDWTYESGHAKCVILPVGSVYGMYGRDRGQRLHLVRAVTTAGDRTFYKDAKRNWRKASTGGRMFSINAGIGLMPYEYTMVKSFKPAHFYVQVVLDITNHGYVPYTCGSSTENLSITGEAIFPKIIDVVTKYATGAETLAKQMLPDEFKNYVYGQATEKGVNDTNIACAVSHDPYPVCVVNLRQVNSTATSNANCQTVVISDPPVQVINDANGAASDL